MNSYLSVAADLARGHFYDKNLDYHLCAVVVRGGKILSIGFNKFGSSGLVEHYKIKEREWKHNVHAETEAILRARRKTDLRGSKIYVARLHKNGVTLAMAKPCPMCQAVLYAYGIKKAYFTTDSPEEEMGVMRVERPT